MQYLQTIATITLIAATGLLPAHAEVFIYPNKGQSAEQTDKDKYACYEWARQQTGYDPTATQPAAAPASPSQSQGKVGRSMARGALGGALIGEIADDDAGKGAAIGAVAGGMFGGMRKREAQMQQQQKAQQQSTAAAGLASNYNRAYAVCLEGRGYTVR